MSGTLSVCPFASFEKCANTRMVSKASDAEDVTRIVASRTSDAAWKATSAVNDAASYGKTRSSSYVVCAASKPPFSFSPTVTWCVRGVDGRRGQEPDALAPYKCTRDV